MKSISSYDIYYAIDTERLKFSGTEKVKGETEGDVWLNYSGFTIDRVKLNGSDTHIILEPEKERFLVDGTHKGEFNLEVHFSGSVLDGLNGLYYSREKDGVFISSHFEATGARLAIPCVDHPNYKAKFNVTLDLPKDYDGISNMPVEKVEINGNRKIIRFEETPPMSTYLLYLGAGKYDIKEGIYGEKQIYLTSAKGKFEQTDMPIRMAVETLEFFGNYFGIEYKLPKLHLIAVPEFAFGAMENWGAITFREIELMIGKSTSSSILKRVDEVISHELAHQWFGNLVTMKWWDDIWLNESFATFMSYKALDKKHPEWEIFGELVSGETGGAMRGDSLRNTHPIHVEVTNPEEIAQIFDEISYGKGASVLRMIEGYVGEEDFSRGVTKYLKDHEFANATGHELWESIEKVSGKQVSKIMESWINLKGFPMIEASLKGDKIHITQSRFFLDSSPESTIWPIPLTVVYKDGTKSVLFDQKEMDIPAQGILYLNVNRTGFYISKYDDSLTESLKTAISAMDKFSRWGVVYDHNSLLMAKEIKLEQFLSVLRLFQNDPDFMMRSQITAMITQLHNILKNTKMVDEFAIEYLRKHLDMLGEKKDGEEINDSVIRGTMQSALALIDIEYDREISPLFTKLQNIPPDQRMSIALAYAKQNNDFYGLREMMDKMDVDEDKIKIISAMGHLKGEDNLEKAWELVKNGQIKKQDSFRVIGSALGEHGNRKFVVERFEEIIDTLDRFFQGTGYTSRFLEGMIPLAGLYDETAIKNFLSKSEDPSWQTGIKKGLEYLNVYQRLNLA